MAFRATLCWRKAMECARPGPADLPAERHTKSASVDRRSEPVAASSRRSSQILKAEQPDILPERSVASTETPASSERGSGSVVGSSQCFCEAPKASCEMSATMASLFSACSAKMSATLRGSKVSSLFRINDDLQDVSDVQCRPMPRKVSFQVNEPNEDVSGCLREAMSISYFDGRTSRFIEDIISEGWNVAHDRIRRGILTRHPDLTEKGVFALAVFSLQIQNFTDDASDEDEFYFQFGNALRHCETEEMKTLKTYNDHFVKGLEAMPKYQGTLWRGVHGDFAGAAGDNFSLHSLINFNAYSSASPSREVAKKFLAGNGVLLKFVDVTNSARDVREVSAYPNEDERTILAGAQFLVVSEAHRSDDGILEIHLKETRLMQA